MSVYLFLSLFLIKFSKLRIIKKNSPFPPCSDKEINHTPHLTLQVNECHRIKDHVACFFFLYLQIKLFVAEKETNVICRRWLYSKLPFCSLGVKNTISTIHNKVCASGEGRSGRAVCALCVVEKIV